jgi:hypothetical protein
MKTVRLTLTLAEARAISRTMSNHIDSDDWQGKLSLYDNAATIRAATKAHGKVSQAIRDALSPAK